MKIFFIGDKHNDLKVYNYLIKNIDNFKNYDIWLEFLYDFDIELIKNFEKNKLKLKENILKNKWSVEYNDNIINFIEKCKAKNVSIFSLEDEKFSLKSFLDKYENFGIFFYLIDRRSETIEGCNYRWFKKIYKNFIKTNKNQLIVAGSMHLSPLENIFLRKKNIKIDVILI